MEFSRLAWLASLFALIRAQSADLLAKLALQICSGLIVVVVVVVVSPGQQIFILKLQSGCALASLWARTFMQDLLLFKRRIMCPARCCCHSCYACCWQTDTNTSSISSGSSSGSNRNNNNSSNTMTHLTTCSSGRPCLPSSSAPHNFHPYIVQYFIYIFLFFSPFLCLHLSSALPYPSAVESFLRPPAVCFYYTPALASASDASSPLTLLLRFLLQLLLLPRSGMGFTFCLSIYIFVSFF